MQRCGQIIFQVSFHMCEGFETLVMFSLTLHREPSLEPQTRSEAQVHERKTVSDWALREWVCGEWRGEDSTAQDSTAQHSTESYHLLSRPSLCLQDVSLLLRQQWCSAVFGSVATENKWNRSSGATIFLGLTFHGRLNEQIQTCDFHACTPTVLFPSPSHTLSRSDIGPLSCYLPCTDRDLSLCQHPAASYKLSHSLSRGLHTCPSVTAKTTSRISRR